jgi:antitoxin HicB
MDYPVTLERDSNKTLLVSFPDFPEAHTFGDTEEDALAHAAEALATVIDAYIKDRREIPKPSAMVAKYRVSVPALVEAKVRLYETMRQQRVNKTELARRLRVHPPQVDRILNVHHTSQVGQLEAAFGALGKRMVFGVEDIQESPTAKRATVSRRSHAGRLGQRKGARRKTG